MSPYEPAARAASRLPSPAQRVRLESAAIASCAMDPVLVLLPSPLLPSLVWHPVGQRLAEPVGRSPRWLPASRLPTGGRSDGRQRRNQGASSCNDVDIPHSKSWERDGMSPAFVLPGESDDVRTDPN
ncbi:MAG: hypothetical protein QOE23_531 [Pseudonocardiales bacterium]|jgi:hypothetical protein|nr:hypothetical protein [Pseudonocardiales bacterium]